MSFFFGIPFEVRETVRLEIGDLIPIADTAYSWRIVEMGEDHAIGESQKDGKRQRFPRVIDLRDEAPGYIMRPSTSGWPIERAYFGEGTVERIRQLGLRR